MKILTFQRTIRHNHALTINQAAECAELYIWQVLKKRKTKIALGWAHFSILEVRREKQKLWYFLRKQIQNGPC